MLNIFLENSFIKSQQPLNSIYFQRKSINTLSFDLIGGKQYFSDIGYQYDITISLMTMETTTNTGKNQKFSRKVQESVEAI